MTAGYCFEWDIKIQRELANYGAWSNILYSVAVEESTLNPFAFNPKYKAHGLMQIRKICRDDYARIYGVQYTAQDTYDYKIALKIAHGYLLEMMRLCNSDLYKALASYHAGWNRVTTKGIFCHDYVQNILLRANIKIPSMYKKKNIVK
jgi:soluble lytic murein transglycosylase-like protein